MQYQKISYVLITSSLCKTVLCQKIVITFKYFDRWQFLEAHWVNERETANSE